MNKFKSANGLNFVRFIEQFMDALRLATGFR